MRNVKRENSLAVTNIELLDEWDYEKNNELGISPYEVSKGQHIEVYWKCPNNEIKEHSYPSLVYAKVAAGKGKGCPYCYGDKVLTGLNDISTTHEDIAQLWNRGIEVYVKGKLLTPETVSSGSNYKVFWKCENKDIVEHSYKAKIADVTTRGIRCNYCAGRGVYPGLNDLKSRRPELMPEWDYEKNMEIGIDPSRISFGTNTRAFWKCANKDIMEHSYDARIADKKVGVGCKYCSGKAVLPGLNDLMSRAEYVAQDWDYDLNEKKPWEVLKGSGEKAWWKCRNKGLKPHSYPLPIVNRVMGHKCPVCHGKLVLPGINDIESTDKKLLLDWDEERNSEEGIFPQNYTSGSSLEVWWKCPNNKQMEHSYKLSIIDRRNGVGCCYCSGRKVLKGLNDLATTNKEMLDEWDYERNRKMGITPDNVSKGKHTVVWWKCPNGPIPHSYPAMVKSRVVDNQRCGICHGLRVEIGTNDLLSFNDKYKDEWDYELNGNLMPEQFTKASNVYVWWKCLKNKKHGSYSAMIARRTTKETGCPICNESHGEKKIREYLEAKGIMFKAQYRFPDRGNLRDDFAIMNKEGSVVATIEFNGKQHYEFVHFGGKTEEAYQNYEIQLKNDKIKSDYLKDNDIKQLVIPYYEYARIDDILTDFLKQISL